MMFNEILLMILPILLAITVHEAAHGYAARYYGDHTAEQLGRLTLNPLAHIDPVGTIAVPVGMAVMTAAFGGSPLIFGWAKPVPVNSRHFKNVRVGMRMTAVAGPLANIVMMVLWGACLWLAGYISGSLQLPLVKMANYGILINAVLFALNMLPVLPLDGGRFVDTFLPARASYSFQKIEPYGMWIVLILLISGFLGKILFPATTLLYALTLKLFGMA